jgi:hypothetical protein
MMGLGGKKRVLMVGGEGVVLFSPSGKSGMERELSVAWDVPDFEDQLTEGLTRGSGKSLVILFDGADQTYRREENIPKLSPIDRPRFVKRKLELAFPSYPIRASMEVKAGGAKKKKGFSLSGGGGTKSAPSYLFVALPETEQVDRVSAAVMEAGIGVAGFGLLPTESASLVTELSEKVFAGSPGRRSRWALLVGQNETGGLRQVVVKDGNLALTRLTPASDAGTSGPGWVEDVIREFKATMTYISRFGYTPEDGLDVMIVCGDIEKEFFSGQDMGVQNFKCLNPGEALKHIGVRSFGLEKNNFADPVHAAWVGKKRSLRLPVRVPSLHRIHAPRLAANLGAIVLALGVIGILGVSSQALLSYNSTQNEISLKENQKQLAEREYTEASKAFDDLPMNPAIVRSAMAVKDMLEKNTVDLSPFLYKFRAALGGDIILEDLKMEHKPSAALEGGARGAGVMAGFMVGGQQTDERGKLKVTFSFSLPDRLPLEQKIIRSEELQAALKTAFPEYDVVILQPFSGMQRDGSLRGTAGDIGDSSVQASRKDVARFEMEGAPL